MKSRASLFEAPEFPFVTPRVFEDTAFKPLLEDSLWSQRVLNLNPNSCHYWLFDLGEDVKPLSFNFFCL